MSAKQKAKNNIKQQINELETKLKKWAHDYYVLNQSAVSDQVYDANYQQLQKILKEHPEFLAKNSITKQVGVNFDHKHNLVANKFVKVKHNFPMLSLDNAFDFESLIKFDKHIKNQLGINHEIEYVCELKVDGLSIAIHYDQGQLKQAITRGDGQIGEDVTFNALMIDNIAKQINFQQPLEVRGEVFMTHSAFKILNATSNQVFANPRNAAAGTLRQLDAKTVKSRQLSAVFYMIPNALALNLKKQSDVLQFIHQTGLNVNSNYKVVQGIEAVIKTLTYFQQLKSQIDFDVDGVVIKVNDLNLYEDIGYTNKYPKAMIAFKFPEQEVVTKLLEIFPTIGRTGKVTYNAKLEPVIVNGSTIMFATLHNADYVRQRQINVGDEVKLKKSGEIIPRILGVSKKHNHTPWIQSSKCPSCSQPLTKLPSEVDQYCLNNNCPARILANLVHFCSKPAMNIVGLSEQTIKTFLASNLITDIPSIYELKFKKAAILQLERFKDKITDKLLSSIENSKNVTLDKFIFALGIRHVGAKIARLLAQRFENLDNLMQAKSYEINEILTLGPAVAQAVESFFTNRGNVEMIQRYLSLGLNLQSIGKIKSKKLDNLTFVLTGEFSKSRHYFSDLISSNGGNVSNAVSKKTDYVVKGLEAGSKLNKALALGIKIIDENTLLKMLNLKSKKA